MEILFSKLSEPSLFLLIRGQKSHTEGSVKIAFESLKSRDFFFVAVGGNPDKGI